jgi:hypothetical protein
MAEAKREDRDFEIWRRYVRGERQADIARSYGTDQGSVSRAIARHRSTIPQETRDEMVIREIDYLTSLRDEVLALWTNTNGAPVTAGRDGQLVLDPDTDEVVRDHTGRLMAVKTAQMITDRLHRVTGLDAPLKVDLGATEQEAARAAAETAVNHLHGGTPDVG